MNFRELVSVCGGELLQFSEERPIQTLLIDSRKAVIGQGSLFFAMKGDRHDGHLFLTELYDQGLRQFIVENDIEPALFPGANILKVNSALAALQAIAAHHRKEFNLPVIGITGSNGKTIVKEWLFQVLSPHLQIAKNPGSYNSQVGVPLSVWQIHPHHELGIFEAGISQPGEMEKLCAVIQPTIGIFTNLGTAHDEGFVSHEQKAEEKAKLFVGCEKVIYCKDHSLIDDTLRKKKIPAISWGIHPAADIRIRQLNPVKFQAEFKSVIFSVELPFQDKASQENAFHVLTFMLMRGYKPAVIAERMLTIRSVAMRLELKQGLNRSVIIDDSYNNDLAGLSISLDFLKNQRKPRKTLILSDILQSGISEADLMKEIKGLVVTGSVTRFIGIGPVLKAHQQQFLSGNFFSTTVEFLQQFKHDDFADEVILVKGARIFKFEKIVQRLQRKVHGTVMEIDLGSMVENLNYFKSRLTLGTKTMAMVKAFAYGSGSEEVANLLQYHRVDYLGVAYADEGIDLRRNNITLPIMVMNPSEESFAALIEYGLEPELYNMKITKAIVDFLNGQPFTVHFKIDSGMHRLGFEESDLDGLIELLRAHKNVRVASIFSHLSGADEKMHDDFSRQQAEAFVRMADVIERSLGYRPLRHLLNSPGILRLPQYQFDMVRLGIGLYGVDPTEETNANLKPVATLKTVVSQIKKIAAGQTIGYGRKGKADKGMTLATIAIGYADGYSRSFSNGKGKVWVSGRLVPVIGNVCMDMTMIDVSGLDVREGDEVILFGPLLPIKTVASWINTIPYEILTSTSERVKRVFFAASI